MQKKIVLAGIYVFLLTGFAFAASPYFAFYPSERGEQFKLFRHNIFNFEITLPVDWTFGVAGEAPWQVIMMYPGGMDTSRFSPGYETISVGIVPTSASLERAHEFCVLGMREKHEGITFGDKRDITLNGLEALGFSYQWPSKAGFKITEDVTLVRSNDRVYSINTRTIPPISERKGRAQKDIVSTFTPIAPVEF